VVIRNWPQLAALAAAISNRLRHVRTSYDNVEVLQFAAVESWSLCLDAATSRFIEYFFFAACLPACRSLAGKVFFFLCFFDFGKIYAAKSPGVVECACACFDNLRDFCIYPAQKRATRVHVKVDLDGYCDGEWKSRAGGWGIIKTCCHYKCGADPTLPPGGAEHILNNFIMIPYLFQLAIKTGLPHKIFTCN